MHQIDSFVIRLVVKYPRPEIRSVIYFSGHKIVPSTTALKPPHRHTIIKKGIKVNEMTGGADTGGSFTFCFIVPLVPQSACLLVQPEKSYAFHMVAQRCIGNSFKTPNFCEIKIKSDHSLLLLNKEKSKPLVGLS